MLGIASTKLADLLKPSGQGDNVNVHVVEFQKEPKPDFDAMKRVIESKDADTRNIDRR